MTIEILKFINIVLAIPATFIIVLGGYGLLCCDSKGVSRLKK